MQPFGEHEGLWLAWKQGCSLAQRRASCYQTLCCYSLQMQEASTALGGLQGHLLYDKALILHFLTPRGIISSLGEVGPF